MDKSNKKADIIREEKKKHLLRFIERKKMEVSSRTISIPMQENTREHIPSINKTNVPRETEKTYIEESNRRKERRKKLKKIKEKQEEIKKKRALAIQEKKHKQEEERRKKKEEQQNRKLEAIKKREEVRLLKEAKKKEKAEKKKEDIRKRQEARLLQEAKKKEELEKRRAEVLNKREEVRQLKEKRKRDKLTVQPLSTIPSDTNNKKREELLSLIEAIKQKHLTEHNQKLLQKQLALAEKKLRIVKAQEEKKQRKLEAIKKREEVRLLKEAKKKEKAEKKKEDIRKRQEARLLQEAKKKEEETFAIPEQRRPEYAKMEEVPIPLSAPSISGSLETRRKQELLEFIKTRRKINEQQIERKRILKQVAIEKEKGIAPQKQPKKAEKVPPSTPISPVIPAPILAKISNLSRESKKTEGDAKSTLTKSISDTKKFISNFTKKKEVSEKPVPVALEKKVPVKYKEPFLLVPFIRRNIFKFVFFILLIGWLWEIFTLMGRFQDPQKRLSEIVGEDITTEKPSPEVPVAEKKLPETETEFKITLKKERIDIEGKRDPFSPGRLTMEVLEKPEATNIVLASKPNVISLIRPSKIVSIIKEEKQMEPEKASSTSKPQTPSYKPILKDTSPPQIQPVEKVKPAEVSPLIMPERRCELIYRGRLVMEGVEYLFIEGKDKTYRVTIGDVVEGFRILRKEKNILYLSKEGIIYEIPIDK